MIDEWKQPCRRLHVSSVISLPPSRSKCQWIKEKEERSPVVLRIMSVGQGQNKACPYQYLCNTYKTAGQLSLATNLRVTRTDQLNLKTTYLFISRSYGPEMLQTLLLFHLHFEESLWRREDLMSKCKTFLILKAVTFLRAAISRIRDAIISAYD